MPAPPAGTVDMAPAPHDGIEREAVSSGRQGFRPYAHQNRLLATLPEADYDRLRRALEPVALPLGRVLGEAGCRAEHAYFPVTGLVSLTQQLASGATAEVAVAGNDGLVGIALVMGGASTTTRAFVRAAGMGFRVRADVLRREFEQCLPLRQVVLRSSK